MCELWLVRKMAENCSECMASLNAMRSCEECKLSEVSEMLRLCLRCCWVVERLCVAA